MFRKYKLMGEINRGTWKLLEPKSGISTSVRLQFLLFFYRIEFNALDVKNM